MDTLELDFGVGPSARARKDIESTLGHSPLSLVQSGDGRQVEHSAFVVDASDGTLGPYDRVMSSAGAAMPRFRSGRPEIDQSIIEAILALEDRHSDTNLNVNSSSASGERARSDTVSLILPPEGYPLDLLSAQITTTAKSLNSVLTCYVLDPSARTSDITPSSSSTSSNSMLVAPRSAVAGLDLPNLGRIYLLNALDLAGMSPSQRSQGGLKRRLGWYDIVTGRLGRLGSKTGNGGGRVISLAVKGSGEEMGLDAVLARRASPR